ncbi:YceD family protein [Sphingomonas sp. Leaf4]|uniref:YceD family protein n=1 Tax=Sphingomonas sp. Leaf4 TaxID=2876553 RepID=UPI001E2AD8E8|nr:YceD family protein [Sphingomonas sp. Leaf4]
MTSEFHRPIRIDQIGEGELRQRIEADGDERRRLMGRFRLLAIDSLVADYALRRDVAGIVATGRLTAQVAQACVASGEPVPESVDEPFVLRFLPESSIEGDAAELDDSAMDTMFYTGASIDLGEAAAETLALALDPYPRSPDAEEVLRTAGVVREEDVAPITALGGLKDLLTK